MKATFEIASIFRNRVSQIQYQPNTNTLKGIYSNTQLYIIYIHIQTNLVGRTVKANSQLPVITYFFSKDNMYVWVIC